MKSRRQNFSEDRRLTINRSYTQPKTSMNVGPIPIDLIIDIHSRLPAKSIARCRCVSKLWASIFRRTYFTELFLTRSLTRPQLLFACQYDGELLFFSSPQPQNPDVIAATQLTRFPSNFRIKLCSPIGGLVFHTHPGMVKGRMKIVPVICNPSTGRSLNLPEVKMSRVEVRCYFGYDQIDKQFKVLSISSSSRVLTLGTEELSWRKIECCIPHYPLHKGICIDGVLYYRAVHSSSRDDIIICFDIRLEKFSFIEVIESLITRLRYGTLINYNGKLGLLICEGSKIYGESRIFELWVLENLKKQEWSKHSYVLPALWKSIVGNSTKLRFVGVTRTNEVVMSLHYPPGPFHLFYFNLERKTVVRVEIQGIPSKYHRIDTFLDHVEDVKLLM